MTDSFRHKIDEVYERIERAAQRSGRTAESVTLVAVTKGVAVERILNAVEAGITHVGENRIQEAETKMPRLPDSVHRHLIGHLQTNKARFVGELFDIVHSIDRLRIAKELGRRMKARGESIASLIQVNVADEESKHGVSVDQTMPLIEEISQIEGIEIQGLMTMAPIDADEKELRRVFSGLRELADRVKEANIPGVRMEHLSMGMSQDYEIAIEEGATIVRVGRAIFG